MSYSIAVRGKTKQEAKDKVADALAPYNFASPHNTHSKDGASITSAIESRIDCFPEPAAGQELVVEAYGHSIAQYGPEGVGDLTSADSTVKVYLVSNPSTPA